MPFTDEEMRAWHEEKRKAEFKPTPVFRAYPVTTCVHCQLPFGLGEGIITDEVSLCDVCSGD